MAGHLAEVGQRSTQIQAVVRVAAATAEEEGIGRPTRSQWLAPVVRRLAVTTTMPTSLRSWKVRGQLLLTCLCADRIVQK